MMNQKERDKLIMEKVKMPDIMNPEASIKRRDLLSIEERLDRLEEKPNILTPLTDHERRLDRLEEALGVMNHMFHHMLKVADPRFVKQIKAIYLETPTYIKEMKESQERIEKMIEEDNK